MPKKFVREARRKAREEAYRAVSTGIVAFQNGSRLKNPQVELPPCYVEVKWRNGGTLPAYIRTLLEFADEARAYVIGAKFAADAGLSPESLAAVAALRIAVTDWLVRSSKILVLKKPKEVFFDAEDQFLSDLKVMITTRVTHIGTSSLETEHHIMLLAKCDRTRDILLGIVSGTIIPINYPKFSPVPIASAARDLMTQQILCEGVLPNRVDFPESRREAITSQHKYLVRRSDCDAFDHVNNCTAIDFFTDAVDMDVFNRVKFICIEYPASFLAGDECLLSAACWEPSNQPANHRIWKAVMTCDKSPTPNGPRAMRAYMTTLAPIDMELLESLEENDGVSHHFEDSTGIVEDVTIDKTLTEAKM